MSAPTTDVWPEVGARVATARQQRGMTQRDLAHALGTSPWVVDRIESGAVDGGRYLSSISEVTQTNQEWFASSAGTESTSTARAHNSDLAHLGAAGKNLVLGSIVLLVTIRLFTEVVPLLPRAGNFVDIPIVLTLAVAATFVPTSRRGAAYLGVGLPALLFLTLAIVSAIANSHRVATGARTRLRLRVSRAAGRVRSGLPHLAARQRPLALPCARWPRLTRTCSRGG